LSDSALRNIPILLLIFIVTAGCTSVRLVADYDKRLDDEITGMQRKTELFLTKMERLAEAPDGAYEKHISFYDEIKADINVLGLRSEALAMNTLTTEQIRLLKESILSLEERHRKGLKSIMIEVVRQGINMHYSAILRLEVVKKRNN
jgi:hypothetical protein